jgi:hypothetical protein
MSRRSSSRLYTSTTFKIVVAVFYGVSILLGWFPEFVTSDRIDLEQVSWALSAIAGAVIVALTKQSNVWALFIIGFIQPLFIAVRAAIEIPEVLQLGLSLWPPLRIGAACAVGGWVVSLLTLGFDRKAFSFSECRKWFMPAWDVLTKTEKVESIVKTVLTVATFLLGIVNLLLK